MEMPSSVISALTGLLGESKIARRRHLDRDDDSALMTPLRETVAVFGVVFIV